MSLKNDVVVSFRLPNDLATFYQKLSELWGVSFSRSLRKVLSIYQRQYGNQKNF